MTDLKDIAKQFIKQQETAETPMDLDSMLDANLPTEEEPRYVLTDDSGEEITRSGLPAWKLPKEEYAKEAFGACHIKYWGTKSQRSHWKKIITAMYGKYGVEIRARREWMVRMIAWASGKNNGRITLVIDIDSLMNAIENETLYEKFKVEQDRK